MLYKYYLNYKYYINSSVSLKSDRYYNSKKEQFNLSTIEKAFKRLQIL